MRYTALAALLLIAVHGSCPSVYGDEPARKDLFEEAKQLSTREDWGNAIARFREFLSQHPDDPRAAEARFRVGYCLVQSDYLEEAIRELTPFETTLAQNEWADDALLQLGHACRGNEEFDQALAIWNRLIEKYPHSPWRTDAALEIIDELYGNRDYAACLPYCERLVKETADFGRITEARYIGAYCLNALSRYDEAGRWMDHYFSPGDPAEAGWRRVLVAQRDLRQGRPEVALAAIDALGADFPDLSQEDRLDLLLRATTMLTRENQGRRAREMLITALKYSAGHSEDNINSVLDQLEEATSGTDGFATAINDLARDAALPLLTRLLVRERQVQLLRDDENANEAELRLRQALANEKNEYARFRAAMLLAELLSEDQEDEARAVDVLKSALPSFHRNDLSHRVNETIKRLER